jgi:two-component system, OmpR family, copper resistance phosphate regulon response regulator CusR
MQALVIEDDHKTANLIKEGLEMHQIDVEVCYDGLMGLMLATRNHYDIIISDLILPEMNGLTLCRKIREAGIHTPLLMLTALGTSGDVVEGLDAGADDYLPKPFELSVLMARVRALTRRKGDKVQTAHVLKIDDLELNVDTKRVSRAGKEINLTVKEFNLLELFLRNQGRVISKVELAEKIWDITFDTGTNVIEVYVNFLRNKVEKGFDKKLIHTQIGHGYIMKLP